MCTQSGSAADTHHIHTHIRCTRCVPRMSHFDKLMRKICLAEVSRSLHGTQKCKWPKNNPSNENRWRYHCTLNWCVRERPKRQRDIHISFGIWFYFYCVEHDNLYEISNYPSKQIFRDYNFGISQTRDVCISSRLPFRSRKFRPYFSQPIFRSIHLAATADAAAAATRE